MVSGLQFWILTSGSGIEIYDLEIRDWDWNNDLVITNINLKFWGLRLGFRIQILKLMIGIWDCHFGIRDRDSGSKANHFRTGMVFGPRMPTSEHDNKNFLGLNFFKSG